MSNTLTRQINITSEGEMAIMYLWKEHNHLGSIPTKNAQPEFNHEETGNKPK